MGDDSVDARVDEVHALARVDRARLEFLITLSHQLRTPAGVIAGYLSLAHEDEPSSAGAVDAARIKARELCTLLDGLLAMAEEELKRRDQWSDRVATANSDAALLVAKAKQAVDRASHIHPGLAVQAASVSEPRERGERRDPAARAARDVLAAACGVHAKRFAGVDREAVLSLVKAVVRQAASRDGDVEETSRPA